MDLDHEADSLPRIPGVGAEARSGGAWRDELVEYVHEAAFPARAPDLVAMCMRQHSPSALWWILDRLEPSRVFSSRVELLDALTSCDGAPGPPYPPLQF